MIIFSAATLFLLSVIIVIILIQNHKNIFLVMLITILLIFGIGFSWLAWDLIKGTPANKVPPQEAQLIHSIVEKPMIFVWIKDQDGHRLYTFPWSKESEKQLQKGMDDIKQGHRVVIKPNHSGSELLESPFRVYRWEHQEQMPKNNSK
jgi:hypothetical protein